MNTEDITFPIHPNDLSILEEKINIFNSRLMYLSKMMEKYFYIEKEK